MLSKSVILLTLVGIIGAAQSHAQINTWKTIEPSVSTRRDVERTLGMPKNPKLNLYDAGNEVINVWYSPGLCKESSRSEWNLKKDIVTKLIVAPKSQVAFTQVSSYLGKGYSRWDDPHMKNIVIYESADYSVKIQTRILSSGIEDVDFISIAPPYSKRIRKCKRDS